MEDLPTVPRRRISHNPEALDESARRSAAAAQRMLTDAVKLATDATDDPAIQARIAVVERQIENAIGQLLASLNAARKARGGVRRGR